MFLVNWLFLDVYAGLLHCLHDSDTVISTFFSEGELTFTFAICHRTSFCLSSVVCNVGALYSGDRNFPQCFYAMWYLGHP